MNVRPAEDCPSGVVWLGPRGCTAPWEYSADLLVDENPVVQPNGERQPALSPGVVAGSRWWTVRMRAGEAAVHWEGEVRAVGRRAAGLVEPLAFSEAHENDVTMVAAPS